MRSPCALEAAWRASVHWRDGAERALVPAPRAGMAVLLVARIVHYVARAIEGALRRAVDVPPRSTVRGRAKKDEP